MRSSMILIPWRLATSPDLLTKANGKLLKVSSKCLCGVDKRKKNHRDLFVKGTYSCGRDNKY